MASYTIEDIELIRRKSGISYQEAVALLDYHNGNVARALVDLERNGRIKPEKEQNSASASNTDHKGAMYYIKKLYAFRLKVKKDAVVILNISLLFGLLALLISPHLLLIGLILALVLGYKISFNRNDEAFAAANLERMVRNAGENVRDTVNDFARSFQETPEGKKTANQAEKNEKVRSYYAASPSAASYQDPVSQTDVPTIQVPVQVESQDGSVHVSQDKDGYSSATIE